MSLQHGHCPLPLAKGARRANVQKEASKHRSRVQRDQQLFPRAVQWHLELSKAEARGCNVMARAQPPALATSLFATTLLLGQQPRAAHSSRACGAGQTHSHPLAGAPRLGAAERRGDADAVKLSV